MRRVFVLTFACAAMLHLAACSDDSRPRNDYFERTIQPILNASCSGNTSGCHRADPADPFQQAAGNLDTTSFDNIKKRPDLLRTYGTYPVPMLLMKAVGKTIGADDDLVIPYDPYDLCKPRDGGPPPAAGCGFVPVEIAHASGGILTVGSPAFIELQKWLENGATRTGLPPPPEPVKGQGNCSTALPSDIDPATVTATKEWQDTNAEFTDKVMGVIKEKGCNAQNCHGAPQSDFYITCGEGAAQEAYNFHQVWSFVANPVDDSEILRRPISPQQGGVAHTGGVHFAPGDEAYTALHDWAARVGTLPFGDVKAHNGPVPPPGSAEHRAYLHNEAKIFFGQNVMPVLLKRGCASEGCHSPGAMNDFKLRAGSQGRFSAIALEKNYDLIKNEFLAFEVPDVRRGRAIAKTILPDELTIHHRAGIAHRAGAVLETPYSNGTADPASCPTFDPNDKTAAAFCVIREWARLEREALVEDGVIDALDAGATIPIVYVERQATHVASPLAFDTYQANSDLLVQDATIDAAGTITGTSGKRSLLDGCPGAASRAAVDVRAPDVANDGTRVVFAMRTSASDSLHVYQVKLDGTGCTQMTTGPQHDFDPAWAPDGSAIVYASTKAGGTSKSGHPQSDLWRMGPDGANPERITFLSNSELSPQFMREGRLTMTTEKGDPGGDFYQLSGRRLNWDLTDYHPLLAQRAESPFGKFGDKDPNAPDIRPSVGYARATDIREAFDGNFLLVLSDKDAKGGAGTLGIFNRSVGPFEADRAGESFLRSLTIPDGAATGRVGMTTNGAYRSPYPLLDGTIMASYAGGSFDLGSVTSLDFDIVSVDAQTGKRQVIIGGPGAQVDAVLALRYPARALYQNRRQLVFGGFQEVSDVAHAIVHVPDAPMLATLLGANLRRGRPIAEFRSADTIAFLDASGNLVGTAPLRGDGSAKVRVPAGKPMFIQLRKGGTALFTMSEEHQYGPGENISMGVRESLFDHICAGCHGSVSGAELDISVTPDALTGASQSDSQSADPIDVGN
jgi:hypothetical protein